MKTHRKIRDGKIGKLKALKIQIWRSVGMKSLSKVKYGSAHVTWGDRSRADGRRMNLKRGSVWECQKGSARERKPRASSSSLIQPLQISATDLITLSSPPPSLPFPSSWLIAPTDCGIKWWEEKERRDANAEQDSTASRRGGKSKCSSIWVFLDLRDLQFILVCCGLLCICPWMLSLLLSCYLMVRFRFTGKLQHSTISLCVSLSFYFLPFPLKYL